MESTSSLHVTSPQDYHALHVYLSMAIPVAEQLSDLHPEDRAMQRLCIHLYDALELMQREPLDEEHAHPDLLVASHSNAA